MKAFLFLMAGLYLFGAVVSLYKLGSGSFPERRIRTASTYAIALPVEIALALWALWLIFNS